MYVVPDNAFQVLEIDTDIAPNVADHIALAHKRAKFTDVEIKVGLCTFQAHKLILARLAFFDAMLSSEFAERNGCVEIQDTTPEAFGIALSAISEAISIANSCVTRFFRHNVRTQCF